MATDLNDLTLANGNYNGVTIYNGVGIKEVAGRTGTERISGRSGEKTWLVWGTSDPTIARSRLEDRRRHHRHL